jgi:hypothetical protein
MCWRDPTCEPVRGSHKGHIPLFYDNGMFVKWLVQPPLLIVREKGEHVMISPWILIIIIVVGLLWAGSAIYRGRK